MLICSAGLFAVEGSEPVRGTTARIEAGDYNIVGEALPFSPAEKEQGQFLGKTARPMVPLYHSQALDFYVPPQSRVAIRFDPAAKSLELLMPEQENPFSGTVLDAIAKAPDWLENDLRNLFSHLTPDYQQKWAETILEANDPYIDEIAFCIAHLSPQYLMSPYAYPQLLIDNARLIYEHDQMLDYVQVVDFGDSKTDPNYYSTTKYRKAKFVDTLQVEVPKDIYYWYIVHPKITDEIPAYIDPEVVENNWDHTNNITSPEGGYFWREFLFSHADPGFATLSDLLKGVSIVWNQMKNSVSSGKHAMEVLNRWQSACMEFTSNEERPHQPVRIYRKHMGRCGENGDMRVAAARAALIPACSVASYSTDHVWNEFWDQRWIHWDGAIDEPFMYVDSWGKKFGSVFRWRSDGCLIPVTDRYARDYATLHLYVLDNLRRPVDGARVTLYTTGLDGSLWFDTYGTSDSDGKVTFLVGINRSYHARVSSDFGDFPAGSKNLLRVLGQSEADEEYSVFIPIEAQKEEKAWAEELTFNSVQENYFMAIDFRTPAQIVRGKDPFDDLEVNAYQFISRPGGRVDYAVLDRQNWDRLNSGESFAGYSPLLKCDSLRTGFALEGTEELYIVLDNSRALHTSQHVLGSLDLYATVDPAIPSVYVLQSFPNPLNPLAGSATISFRLPQKSMTELVVYNLLGQKVKTLINETRYAGSFSVDWNGRDELDQLVPAGIYFCKLKTDLGESSQKMLVIH